LYGREDIPRRAISDAVIFQAVDIDAFKTNRTAPAGGHDLIARDHQLGWLGYHGSRSEIQKNPQKDQRNLPGYLNVSGYFHGLNGPYNPFFYIAPFKKAAWERFNFHWSQASCSVPYEQMQFLCPFPPQMKGQFKGITPIF
jgi:hypothetical protein